MSHEHGWQPGSLAQPKGLLNSIPQLGHITWLQARKSKANGCLAMGFGSREPARRAQAVSAVCRLAEEAGLVAAGQPVLKGLFINEETASERLTAELQVQVGDRLTVMRSHPLFVEVTSPNVSKGKALAFLADWYGIPRAETIAVGDSGNDLSMIEWAGLGVAVANATPEVLAAADWIAPPVSENGVVAVIERFILSAT